MARRETRIRIDAEGRLEVVDPDLASLGLLRDIDPSFRIRRAALPGFTRPRLARTRAAPTGVARDALADLPTRRLEAAHAAGVAAARRSGGRGRLRPGEASLLDVKAALAERALRSCRLCARECGADRAVGERGLCGLGTGAILAEHFVHVAEEPPINPSLVLGLAGCGLRCRFCQQSGLRRPEAVEGRALDPAAWGALDPRRARSLSFAGGNPDESIPAVLRFLCAAPAGFRLPIVWNCHGFSTRLAVDLLDGVVDAWVPDFKFGADACGRDLAGVRGYPAAAIASIARMAAQGVPVIVRMLVLPGHVDCCHRPALAALSGIAAPDVVVSVRGQYCPDGDVGAEEPDLSRRPRPWEVRAVREEAVRLGLGVLEEVAG